jgi:outer membrane protein OmpA-like peptidoglycan-associated protein
LGEFAKALQDPRLKGERFEIDGYTDATGAKEYNQGLSERRAIAVVSYLTSLGLDVSQFVAKGFGKTKPRVSDPYSPENRRVETHLVTPPPAQFDLLVNCDFDSDKLTKSATENLGEFAKALQDPRLKGQKFEIDGYTDATGAAEYNQGLSERRANAVVSYLTSQGLDASEFVVKGFGKRKPRVPDPHSPKNRRVETHLTEWRGKRTARREGSLPN